MKQGAKIESRPLAKIIRMICQEQIRALAPFFSQHAEEPPFRVELGRHAELDHARACDSVKAGVCSLFRPLSVPGSLVGEQALEHRNATQLLLEA